MLKKGFQLLSKSFLADIKVYITISSVLFLILAFHSLFWLIPGVVTIGVLYWYYRSRSRKHQQDLDQYIDELVKNVEKSTFYALKEMPMGIAIFNEQGFLNWRNQAFEAIFTQPNLSDMRIDAIMPDMQFAQVIDCNGERKSEIFGKIYLITHKVLKNCDEVPNDLLLVYLRDVTALEKLKKSYDNERLALAYIQIDNLSDVQKGMSDGQRSSIVAEVDKLVAAWVTEFGGVYKRYSEDLYFATLDKYGVQYLIAHKFDILDRAREIKVGNKIPITFSIGIATDEDSVIDTGQKAQSCLDIALGRGGDQATVSIGGNMQFFGGKTPALEKNTRVRARIVAQALQELVVEADKVFVMGHANEDYDSLGSAIGVAKMALVSKKPTYIITSGRGVSLNKFAELLPEYKEYDKIFISGAAAAELATANSLLFIVDHHRPALCAAPDMLELVTKKVIIDHHRRAEDIIKDNLIVYLEPSSSSTSELVAELLYYYEEHIDLNRLEASMLYAGIVVDTKNFAVQTGARTFEAASVLRRAGADPNMVRQLFSEDINTAKARAQLISLAEFLPGGIIMSCSGLLEAPSASVAIAQAADQMLLMDGAICSVVIANIDKDTTLVSARSLGKINMQIVMEELGGGGHQTVAGVQLKGVNNTEVREQIINLIKKQMEEHKENESNTTTRS